jgi:prevent-host-death family protein
MGKPVNIHDARRHFSRLVERASRGEEIIIARAGRPVARLGPLATPARVRRPALLKGKLRIPKDFDAPLPEDLLRAFEGR